MTVNREDISGSSQVVTAESYEKSISSVIGGGSISYGDHSAPGLNAVVDVLGWSNMRVTETYRHLSAGMWNSKVTVRAAAIELMEKRLGKRHIFISAGYVQGIKSIVPLDQRELVEVHEKGGDQGESDDAWTAQSILTTLAGILGVSVSASVLDYTVSISEFGENDTVMEVIQQLFGMYQPRVVYVNDTFLVIDRLATSLGGNATLNSAAIVVDQRESRETLPSSVKVVGGPTSRSKFLKEKPLTTFRETVCEQTYSWEGYGMDTLSEQHESETTKVQIEHKYGTDDEGNRKFLVRTKRTTWEHREISTKTGRGGGTAVEGAGVWIKIREETTFNKYSRTSNLWESPRLDFTVECLWQHIWEKDHPPPEEKTGYEKFPINYLSGWSFTKYGGKAVSYTFHRYIWGDSPITQYLVNPDGEQLSASEIPSAGSAPPPGYSTPPNEDFLLYGSSAGGMAGAVPGSFAVFGGAMGNPTDVNPGSFATVSGPTDSSPSETGEDGGNTLGGDYLRGEIITHKAILISKGGDKIVFKNGSRCYVPAFKVDRWQGLTTLAMYFDEGGSSRGRGSATTGATGVAGGGPAGGKAVTFGGSSASSEPAENVGPGEAAPGGFSDDFFNQFGTVRFPTWGSEIILYTPLTSDTHGVFYQSVYYDESIDYGDANNVAVETGFQMVGEPNPRAPLKKSRVLGTWTVPLKTESVPAGGTGPTITINNPAIAKKEDAQRIAVRIALLYGRGNKQFTTISLTADLTPEVGWGIAGSAIHPNGPTIQVGENGFLSGFTKSRAAGASERIVQLTVESDIPT